MVRSPSLKDYMRDHPWEPNFFRARMKEWKVQSPKRMPFYWLTLLQSSMRSWLKSLYARIMLDLTS